MSGLGIARAALITVALALLIAGLLVASPPTAAGPQPDEQTDGPSTMTQITGEYFYEITRDGDVRADFDDFASTVTATLADSRGWHRSGVRLTETSGSADFEVVLASPSVVDDAHSVCSPHYSCRVGDRVLVNDVRWREGTSSWSESLEAYRQHVINHEVGHWLGLGHSDCPGAGEPAPVMQQQSIDLQGCEENSWPLDREIQEVADLHGTTPGDPGDAEMSLPAIVRDGRHWHLRERLAGGAADIDFAYGREGDDVLMGDWNGDGRQTPGVRRGKTWHLRDALRGGEADRAFEYGRADDVPVVGDWDGDGQDTVGVRRGETWHLRDALRGGAADHAHDYGEADDTPLVGDWNGDGSDSLGFRRGRTWHLQDQLGEGQADHVFSYGRSDDHPLVWR